MKYFQVEVNEKYVAPMPMGWYGIIDKKTLRMRKAYEMPKYLLFPVNRHMQMVFTDILTFPCFMVSEMVRDVIKKYNPFICFVRIVLLDKERKKSMPYYIPFMDKIECIKGSLEEIGRKQIVVEREKIDEKKIVEIIDEEKSCVIMRMDLIESILRRGAIGVGLKEVHFI